MFEFLLASAAITYFTSKGCKKVRKLTTRSRRGAMKNPDKSTQEWMF